MVNLECFFFFFFFVFFFVCACVCVGGGGGVTFIIGLFLWVYLNKLH